MATEEEIESWQTDPDAAYTEAERRIEEAKRTNATMLNFSRDRDRLRAFVTLPPQIASLTALQTLYLDSTQVTDLAPLASLNSLQRLYLDDTQVIDLAPLASLNSLQILCLNSTQVTDLSPLASLNRLQRLDLRGIQVSDLAPLASLNSLQRLTLTGTQVTDLAPVRGLKALVKGAKQSSHDGLHFANTPAAGSNDAFRSLVELKNPERTIQTLQYLNGKHPKFGGAPAGGGGLNNEQYTFNLLLTRPPATIVDRAGRVDLEPFEPDDLPEHKDDSELSYLPRQQRNLIDSLIDGLGDNQKSARTALRHYREEVAPNGAVLQILKDAFTTIKAGLEQAVRENALDEDTKAAWATFERNNTLYFAHYPFDSEREEAYRNAEVDWERALAEDPSKLFAAFLQKLKENEEHEIIGANLQTWAEVSTSVSEVLRDAHFSGNTSSLLAHKGPGDIDPKYSTPLEPLTRRTLATGAVLATNLHAFLESEAGKKIKNVTWLITAVKILRDGLMMFF